jgi:hypothetical protein
VLFGLKGMVSKAGMVGSTSKNLGEKGNDGITKLGQIDGMPRRELKYPMQVEEWLADWGSKMKAPGEMILIGSGALLWHAAQRQIEMPLPENSMDVDPITQNDEVAELCYEAHIGSPFERENGWHVNLMPNAALNGLPTDWRQRSSRKSYGLLSLLVPAPKDILVPKLHRGEARDLAHQQWALYNGLIPNE